MNFLELIEKKKTGKPLSDEEIRSFIEEYTKGNLPDYQVSALLMAIYFQGLSTEEAAILTEAMVNSGDRIDLSQIKGSIVDKHSTGGVGDTVTLVLGPMVAALGVPFGKMSGRGLGHTGGTLDKLESIPGVHVDMTVEEFIRQTNDVGIAVAGQTGDIAPADKKLYALRDATETVDQVGLIAASILSKKIAVDSDALILDVKVGSGAFMKTVDDARELAYLMVNMGKRFDKKVMAVITSMEEPLGYAVGNILEVQEAVAVLNGEGPEDLREICLRIGAKVLALAGVEENEEKGIEDLEEVLRSGAAFKKFLEFTRAQGSTLTTREEFMNLPLSPYETLILGESDGYVAQLDALLVGEAARDLGAGRMTMDDPLDYGAGVLLTKKIGDPVKKGEVIARLYGEKNREEAKEKMNRAFAISQDEPKVPELILEDIY